MHLGEGRSCPRPSLPRTPPKALIALGAAAARPPGAPDSNAPNSPKAARAHAPSAPPAPGPARAGRGGPIVGGHFGEQLADVTAVGAGHLRGRGQDRESKNYGRECDISPTLFMAMNATSASSSPA